MFFETRDRDSLIQYVNEKIDSFLDSDALKSIFEILDVSVDDISDKYNARRRADGSIIEPQLIINNKNLEKYRYELYPLLYKLNFYTKNKPAFTDYNHIAVLGGALNACYMRTECAKKFVTPDTLTIDGVSCFRPINPVERKNSKHRSNCDTEFGALFDAFAYCFGLDEFGYEDDFNTNRNLNSVSCIRTFGDKYNDATLRVYASPSLEPDNRRADTGDCIIDYINNNTFTDKDKLLFISHNRYCMRQFLQIIFYLLKNDTIYSFDVIGYVDDEHILTEETYNVTVDMQELIAIIDWCGRFREEYR